MNRLIKLKELLIERYTRGSAANLINSRLYKRDVSDQQLYGNNDRWRLSPVEKNGELFKITFTVEGIGFISEALKFDSS